MPKQTPFLGMRLNGPQGTDCEKNYASDYETNLLLIDAWCQLLQAAIIQLGGDPTSGAIDCGTF